MINNQFLLYNMGNLISNFLGYNIFVENQKKDIDIIEMKKICVECNNQLIDDKEYICIKCMEIYMDDLFLIFNQDNELFEL